MALPKVPLTSGAPATGTAKEPTAAKKNVVDKLAQQTLAPEPIAVIPEEPERPKPPPVPTAPAKVEAPAPAIAAEVARLQFVPTPITIVFPEDGVIVVNIKDRSGSMSAFDDQNQGHANRLIEAIREMDRDAIERVVMLDSVISSGASVSKFMLLKDFSPVKHHKSIGGTSEFGEGFEKTRVSLEHAWAEQVVKNAVRIKALRVNVFGDLLPSGESGIYSQEQAEKLRDFVKSVGGKIQVVAPDETVKHRPMLGWLGVKFEDVKYLAGDPKELVNFTIEVVKKSLEGSKSENDRKQKSRLAQAIENGPIEIKE